MMYAAKLTDSIFATLQLSQSSWLNALRIVITEKTDFIEISFLVEQSKQALERTMRNTTCTTVSLLMI